MSVLYKLTVKNDSDLGGSICLYQKDLQQERYGNLYSTAWFTKRVAPGTRAVLNGALIMDLYGVKPVD